VELQGQSLIGSIPSQLSWLTGLQRLILTSNRLSGSIPKELFTNLVQLEVLDLGFNKLTGPLPPSLSSLVQLRRFSVNGNRLTGSCPSRLPPSLQILELNANPFLSGSLPLQAWSDYFLAEKKKDNGTMSQLTMLNIGATAISGTIHGPSFATNAFEQLTSFVLYGTRLNGTIPTEIGHLSNLKDLGFSDLALLTGTLPTQMYELTNLERFIMVSVEIHGHFLQNARISQLSNLRSLVVTNSHLSGTLPTELGLLTELEELRIAYSYMTGTIPSELGRLTKLEAGWFHGTQLTGSVPSEVCALPAIQFDWRISCQVECGCCHFCI
jgi:Leucine-rich repeat (LRR) protein